MYISDLYEDDLEISIKVVIVGNGAVGKSSMIQRYCRGIFTQNYKKTIGVDFLEKQLRIMSEDVRLMLWDTAGQEEFDAITKAYYRGAQACVVAFSTTDRASFDAVKKWKRKVEDECGHVPMVLVQNKIDLLHEAQVSAEEVERLAKELRMRLYRTSVKEDLNVASVFQHLAEHYVAKVKTFSGLDHLDLLQIGGGGQPASVANAARPYGTAADATANTGRAGGLKKRLSVQQNNGLNRRYGRAAPQQQQANGNACYYGGGGGFHGGFSPQDYLNNPMFDRLGQHRRYWPAGLAAERTITLRPLGAGLGGKGGLGGLKKGGQLGRNACRVL